MFLSQQQPTNKLAMTEPAQTPPPKMTTKNRLLGIGIFAAATVGFFLYTRARPGKATLPIVYPPPQSLSKSHGRIFQTVDSPEQFDIILNTPNALNGTLFATFVRLGEAPSNSMATHMWEIVDRIEDPEYTSTVCVELSGGRNDELASKYMITSVPSVLALKKTIPYDIYVDEAVGNSNTKVNEVDRENLCDWVEHVLERSLKK